MLSDPLSCDTLANEDTASLQDTHSDSVPAVGGHNTGTGAPQAQRPLRLDILPPPPGNTQSRRSPMVINSKLWNIKKFINLS